MQEVLQNPANSSIQLDEGRTEATDNPLCDADNQACDKGGYQGIVGEPALNHQQVTSTREEQTTPIDVTDIKDCGSGIFPTKTSKCDKQQTVRKFSLPQPSERTWCKVPRSLTSSKYRSHIKWWTPFMEYDKSVVIKLSG
jgi:hypothetical protein